MEADRAKCFSERLTSAASRHFKIEDYWNQNTLIHNLKDHVNRERSTISKWLNGTEIPPLDIIIQLASLLNVSIDWLLCMENVQHDDNIPDLYPILRMTEGQSHYDAIREPVILSATQSLWFVLRTTHTLQLITDKLRKLMENKVQVRLVVSNPKDKATMTHIARRGYHWLPPKEDVKEAKRTTDIEIKKFKAVVEGHDLSDFLEIMPVNFFPSSVFYIADALRDNGELFAVVGRFGEDPFVAPYLLANRKHEAIFDDYCDQFIRLWNYGAETSGQHERKMKSLAELRAQQKKR